jgi:hypothetical protein
MAYAPAKMQGKSEIKSAYGCRSFFLGSLIHRNSTLDLRTSRQGAKRHGWIVNSEVSESDWKDFAKRSHPSKFDIRNSAVRCLIQVIQGTRLIIKKPYYFGVVSYKEGKSLNPETSSRNLQQVVRKDPLRA